MRTPAPLNAALDANRSILDPSAARSVTENSSSSGRLSTKTAFVTGRGDTASSASGAARDSAWLSALSAPAASSDCPFLRQALEDDRAEGLSASAATALTGRQSRNNFRRLARRDERTRTQRKSHQETFLLLKFKLDLSRFFAS